MIEKKAPPLTDEELAHIKRHWWSLMTFAQTCPQCKTVILSANEKAQNESPLPRLLAEVRRLRSGEWLEKAAEEIAADEDICDEAQAPETVREIVLAILRKHRDNP